MFHVAPKGLADPAEDVCAAAGRVLRLVTQRFLPPPAPIGPPALRKGTCATDRTGYTREEEGNDGGNGEDVMLAVGRRDRGARRRGTGKKREPRRGGGGDGRSGDVGVFDLVWKALGALHQDSACIEVRGDLTFQTCNPTLAMFLSLTTYD